MSYQDVLNEDQRLVLLRGLLEMPGYSSNDSILHTVLEKYGHHLSRDKVRTHLFWLKEQELVNLDTVSSTLIADLTGRGEDVARGRANAPGVKRPGPKR